MKRLFFLLAFMLIATPAWAICILVPITGDGSEASPYRPALDQFPKFHWSAHIPSNADGTPKFSDAYVCFTTAVLPPGLQKLAVSDAAAKAGMLKRDPKAEFKQFERTSLLKRAYQFAAKYFAIAIAWAASAQDNFNRADGALGANWSTGYGSEGSASIVSNAAQCPSGVRCVDSYNAFTPTNDQYAQGMTLAFNLTGDGDTGIGVRLAAPSTFTGYFVRCGIIGSDTTVLQKRLAGSGTNLATEAATTWAASDVVRLEASGTSLTVKRNGSTLLSTTDPDIASGRGGIFLNSLAAGSSFEARIDDFEIGDLGGAAVTVRRRIVILP